MLPTQVRKEPDVQELRVWQREWREENRGIQDRVSEFWDKKMPEDDKMASGDVPLPDDVATEQLQDEAPLNEGQEMSKEPSQ